MDQRQKTPARFVALAFFLCSIISMMAAPAIIPLPRQMTVQPGTFTLCPSQTVPSAPSAAAVKILADPNTQNTARYLASMLFRSTGYRFQMQTDTNGVALDGCILLTTQNANTNLGSEGYELTVASNSVVIRAPADAGVFYGVQSFLQLLPVEIFSQRPVQNVAWTAPCVQIEDWPRFAYRGWMLDVTRHFFTVDEVKPYIDAMALHKLNHFHMHLVDDQGWRIEIKKYPLLTEVGGWRDGINWDLNKRSSTAWSTNGKYGGFYTQADIREIVAYAQSRHITVVPEIEMPGHSTAAASAYPQYFCNPAHPYDTDTLHNGQGVFCPARPETMPFLQDILTEVMDLFPGRYIHVGGDEVNFSLSWQGHSLDRALTNALGINSWQQYQAWFTQQIANWLRDEGRQMIGWSEIQNGGVLSNAVCMDWLSKAVVTASAGWPVIMSPSAICYLNRPEYSGGTWWIEPRGQPGSVVPLNTLYSYEPVPSNLPSQYVTNIIGAQGNLWSEYVPSFKNIGLRAYPRLCAIAELTWTLANQKDFVSFTNRLATHTQRFDHMELNYNRGTATQIGAWTPAQTPPPAAYATLDWNITTNVAASGEVSISFRYTTGSHGLDIEWVALLENGIEIDRDTHAGWAGATPTNAIYVLQLPERKSTATYSVRASMKGRNGTNSNGGVYFPRWN